MNASKTILTLILGSLIAAVPAANGTKAVADDSKTDQVDPSGTWRWEYEMNGETRKDALVLNLEKDGKIVGKYIGNGENEFAVKNGKLDGNKLTVDVALDFQGTAVACTFSGEIDKDSLDGDVVIKTDAQTWEYEWTPQRSVHLDDVVGTWKLKIETPDGTVLRPTLKVSKDAAGKKLVGEYVSEQGYDLTVNKLELDGNHLILAISAEFQGTELKVDYKARPYGDKMSGTLAYDFGGTTGDGEFTAERATDKKAEKS